MNGSGSGGEELAAAKALIRRQMTARREALTDRETVAAQV